MTHRAQPDGGADRPARRRGSERDAPRRPSRTTVLLAALGLVLVIGGGAAAAYFSPLMSVRSLDVVGTRTVDANQVRGLAQTAEGTPLLQVDTNGIASRVSALPAVESVRVVRSYPSTLTVEVTERTPVVTVGRGEQIGVMDRLGMVYVTAADRKALPPEMAALPHLTTPNPGAGDLTTKAVLTVVQDLPGWLRERVVEVHAESPADITLVLKSKRRAVWGDASQTAEKADALRLLLKVQGSEYNVSSPEFPAVS